VWRVLVADADPVLSQIGSGLLGGIITAAAGAALLLVNNWHTRSRENRADSLKEWRDAAEMHKSNDAECRRRLDAMQLRLDAETAARVRAETRIEALEEALKREGIDFKPYHPVPAGSGPHRPLPSPERGDS
jgi:biopolymer transport protein ExbB/TolQ